MHTQHKVLKLSGFTIVELLIVIVVIAILAAISIVAYNGIQERARFAAMRSDLSSLNKAIQLYFAEKGSYPITLGGTGVPCSTGTTSVWCGWDQSMGDGLVPGLIPNFTPSTPQLPASNANGDTYLYKSNGIDYKLIRYKGGGLSTSEQAAFADLRTTDCNSTYNTDRWGYWSSDIAKCW